MESWNESEVYYWNVTSVVDEPDFLTETVTDRLLRPPSVAAICAITTNFVFLVVVIVRLYTYGRSDCAQKKVTWVRLHYVGVVGFLNMLRNAHYIVIIVLRLYEGTSTTMTESVCWATLTLWNWLSLLIWLYMVAIGVQTLLQILHPYSVTGRNQLIFWSVLHPCLWILPLLPIYFSIRNIYSIHVIQLYDGEELKYCMAENIEAAVPLENFLLECTFIAVGIISYFALISLVGVCVVKPSRDSNSRDSAMLHWAIDTRGKAAIFVAVLAFLACALCLPWHTFYALHRGDFDEDVLKTYSTLEAVERCFNLVFPFCCLILHEMGIYSLIGKLRRMM